MMGPLLLSVVVSVTPPPEVEVGSPGEAPAVRPGAADPELWLSEVLASCENALGLGECTRDGDSENLWQASVVFRNDAVTITLARTNRMIVRSLEFLPDDSEKQRRVAAGLLVAAMTAAARLSEPEPKEPVKEKVSILPPAPVAPAPPPKREEKKEPTRRAARYLELAAMTGPTLGGAHFGGGALLSATMQARAPIGFGGGVDGLYSQRDDFRVLKLGVSVGPRLGLLTELQALSWFLALEGVVDYTRIQPALPEVEARGAMRGGGRLRTSVAFGSGGLRPLLGVGITALSPGLEIRGGSDPGLLVPAFLGCAFVGLLFNHWK